MAGVLTALQPLGKGAGPRHSFHGAEWAAQMAADRAGGCVCGAVRYRTTGEALRVTMCHGTWCQRRTCTAFGMEVVFDAAHAEFSGTPATRYRHVSDESGRWLQVEFCPRCGANLGFTLEAAPGLRAVPAGTFDDPGFIGPEQLTTRDVFTRSRRDWAELSPLAETYETHFRK
jgi:hypothetical protein